MWDQIKLAAEITLSRSSVPRRSVRANGLCDKVTLHR
jgi:hypothetical protein